MPEKSKFSPAELCQSIAQKKINLPYFTYIRSDRFQALNFMVDPIQGLRISLLIEENIGKKFGYSSDNAILSIFPHNNNPEITGRLFKVFALKGVMPEALANSPSAISAVLKEEYIDKTSKALFGPFSFSAYRTPDDWKLAQKGKEHLYKEVIASYQEQKPKVYALDYHNDQELLQLRMDNRSITHIGAAFNELARIGLNLIFSATGSLLDKEGEILAFSLPASRDRSHMGIIKDLAPDTYRKNIYPVAVFSMNGPHFGDRYGIVSELLTAFDKDKIDLLGLSCTIASITGVVPASQLNSSILTIKECFEVPSVIKKN